MRYGSSGMEGEIEPPRGAEERGELGTCYKNMMERVALRNNHQLHMILAPGAALQ